MSTVMGLLFVAIGVWSVCGGAFALRVFMDHAKTRSVVAVLGRAGARAFFVALGAGMIGLGTFFILAGQ